MTETGHRICHAPPACTQCYKATRYSQRTNQTMREPCSGLTNKGSQQRHVESRTRYKVRLNNTWNHSLQNYQGAQRELNIAYGT